MYSRNVFDSKHFELPNLRPFLPSLGAPLIKPFSSATASLHILTLQSAAVHVEVGGGVLHLGADVAVNGLAAVLDAAAARPHRLRRGLYGRVRLQRFGGVHTVRPRHMVIQVIRSNLGVPNKTLVCKIARII